MERAMPRVLGLWIKQHRWVSIALLVGTLSVYLRTLSPGALGGDPGELQFVPYILGMPHPTGTPLYCLLGKVWSTLLLGPTVAWRMNMLAAVSASLATVLVYRTVYTVEQNVSGEAAATRIRESDSASLVSRALRFVPALSAAISLGFGLTFWEQALLADKYAFNALMVALVLYLVLYWGQTRSPAALSLLAVTYGLSLAHHRTMALFAPTLLAYVWAHERGAMWRDRRRLLRLVLLCLLPLLLYLYLPWAESRGLPPGTWHPRTFDQWYDYLFDTGRTGLVYVDPDDLGEMLLFYARTLLRDFTWVGGLLGLLGLACQFRRRWLDASFLFANFVLQAFLAANHHVPRHWVYFIPSFVIFALWVGEALVVIWRAGERWTFRVRRVTFAVLPIFCLAMLAWPLVPFYERYLPLREAHLGAGVMDVWRQTLKQGHMADRVGQAIASVQPDAVIVCDWEQATPLWYYQQVEGLRSDVEIVYPIERLDEAAGWGHPLYIARAHAGLADRWHPSCSDSLIALQHQPSFGLPADIALVGTYLAEGEGSDPVFELAGFAYGGADYRPGGVVPLSIYWRAIQPLAHDYAVSLRVFDSRGGLVYQVDSQHPVLGMYPTSGWTAGEVVTDYYEIQIPRELPSGTYEWGVVLYRTLPEGGWQSMRLVDTGEEMARGGILSMSGPGR